MGTLELSPKCETTLSNIYSRIDPFMIYLSQAEFTATPPWWGSSPASLRLKFSLLASAHAAVMSHLTCYPLPFFCRGANSSAGMKHKERFLSLLHRRRERWTTKTLKSNYVRGAEICSAQDSLSGSAGAVSFGES